MARGDKKYRLSNEALNEVKDRGILLYLANAFICEAPILKKIGSEIEKDLEAITNHVNELKIKAFGKQTERVDISEPLDWISNTAGLLKKGEIATRDRCADGELGKEFNEKFKSLIEGIRSLRAKVEGKSVSYGIADSLFGVFDFFRTIGNAIITSVKLILKIVGVFAAVALLVFLVLFFTMESERTLIKEIEKNKEYMSEKEEILFKINEELREIQKQVVGTRRSGPGRRTGIERMDLNLKGYQLNEEKEKVEIDIDLKKAELEENLKKLEILRQKPFAERLFGKRLNQLISKIQAKFISSETQAE